MTSFTPPSFSSLVNSIGMKFVLLPSGSFMMGSPENEPGRYDDAIYHKVTLTKPFYISTTVVTQGQWFKLMGRRPWLGYGGLKSETVKEGDDYPAVYISWDACSLFIKRLNESENANKYRLPTEAEWEYACRAGSTTAFANGDIEAAPVYGPTDVGEHRSTIAVDYDDPNLDDMGWNWGNANLYIHRVAQENPNKWGFYDMHGNVWEWCQDWDGDYPSNGVIDPTGPQAGVYKVIRGGSFRHKVRMCRSAHRNRGGPKPKGGDDDLGLRLVKTF